MFVIYSSYKSDIPRYRFRWLCNGNQRANESTLVLQLGRWHITFPGIMRQGPANS